VRLVELSGKKKREYLKDKISDLETNRTKISMTYVEG
jgi:hypothetical protein